MYKSAVKAMKIFCPKCEAESDSSNAIFCRQCGTKLLRNAESITCNGDDECKRCMEKIKLGNKFCPNCGRKVDSKEFLIGCCEICFEKCPVSSRICTLCLADTSGSDDLAEITAFNNVLDQCGYSELKKLIEKNDNLRQPKINIAITGEPGSGKSSLINALRGLVDDDPEAARTDCIEATMNLKAYPHPEHPNVVLWDMPGVGTRRFPQETYIEKVHLNDYDFTILVSSTRFTQNDTWLAEKIKNLFPDSYFFFVRTKIDVDLGSLQKARSKHISDEELQRIFMNIKKACYDNLEKAKIKNPYVFMVDNHDRSKFEFGELANMLAAKVSALKKDALIMTIHGLTKKICAPKYDLCIERMNAISKQAAIAAMESNRKKGERLEVDILKQEVMHYTQQFGIDTSSFDIVARRFGFDRDEMFMKLNSETHIMLRNFDQFYLTHDKVVLSIGDNLPFLGRVFQLKSYQKQFLSLLKLVLDKCIDENYTLQKNIAVWSLNPKLHCVLFNDSCS